MAGLERNSDLVKFSSQAPLFARRDVVRWMPNNIYFTQDRSFVTPSYEVQRIFSENRVGTILSCMVESELAPLKEDKKHNVPSNTPAIVANAGITADGKTLVVKVINCSEKETSAKLSLRNAKTSGEIEKIIYPAETGLVRDDCNTFCRNVATQATVRGVVAGGSPGEVALSLKPLSLMVLRIGLSGR